MCHDPSRGMGRQRQGMKMEVWGTGKCYGRSSQNHYEAKDGEKRKI